MNMEYIVELLMPKLSREATQGEIQQWFKRNGQLVRKGEGIAEIHSGDQITICKASDHGMLVEILAEEGRPVSAGQVIARLHFNGESAADIFGPSNRIENPEYPEYPEEVALEVMEDDGWSPIKPD